MVHCTTGGFVSQLQMTGPVTADNAPGASFTAPGGINNLQPLLFFKNQLIIADADIHTVTGSDFSGDDPV